MFQYKHRDGSGLGGGFGGGNGQRLGLDKACPCREGKPLLPRDVALLGRQFPEVLVAIGPQRAFLAWVPHVAVPEEEARRVDPELRSFVNLNTPGDVRRWF